MTPSALRWARRFGVAGMAGVLTACLSLVAATGPASASMSSTTLARSSWAYVDSHTPNATHLDPVGDVPVGRIRDHVYRSYLTFDLSEFVGRKIGTVGLFGPETEAADCAHRSVELWTTAPVTALTTWRHQPEWRQKIDTVGAIANSTCPFPRLEWNATAAVQAAVAAGERTLTLGLRATDERNPQVGRWLGDLRLTIEYDTAPDAPVPVSTGGTTCATTEPYPWLNTLRPTLTAKLSDPDGGVIDTTFAVWPLSEPTQRTTLTVTGLSSGSNAVLGLPAGVLADGGSYGWAAQSADSEGLASAWSKACTFQVDVTSPANPPAVTRDLSSPQGQGIPQTFTFSANGAADVVGFLYGWVGASTYVAADHAGGSVSIDLAPPRFTNILSVSSVDRAGNFSPPAAYQFNVPATEPLVTGTGQPKAGGTITIDLQPGVHVPGYDEVVSYAYTVNDGDSVTVPARADGGATAEVPLVYGFNDVKVTSTSTNGWVSPPAEINYYADNSPTVSSPDYPENGDSGGPAGQPGTFTLSSNLAGSTRFAYSFDGLTWETVPVGPDGTATITWTPTSPGFQNLYAYSETADGIQSDWYLYGFAVS